jgi:hypothetical protein
LDLLAQDIAIKLWEQGIELWNLAYVWTSINIADALSRVLDWGAWRTTSTIRELAERLVGPPSCDLFACNMSANSKTFYS